MHLHRREIHRFQGVQNGHAGVGVGGRVDDDACLLYTSIAEDFSEYMQLCPGAFFLYGSGCEYPLHSDHFAGDEQALITACAMYAQVAADALSQI